MGVPKHYKSTKNIDVIDFCLAYNLDFCSGNVVKYVVRAGKKQNNTKLEDLNKALDYLNRLIQEENGKS